MKCIHCAQICGGQSITGLLSLFMFQVYITVVDNNDNPPVFSQPTYEVTVSEDLQPDTEVVQVVASDLDRNQRLTFSLQSSIDPTSLNLFHIHPSSGTIFTSQPLDRESCAQHILTVMVSLWEHFFSFGTRKNVHYSVKTSINTVSFI